MSETNPPSDPFARPPELASTSQVPASAPAQQVPWKLLLAALAVVAIVVIGVMVIGGDDDSSSDGDGGGGDSSLATGEYHLMRYAENSITALAADGAVERTIDLPDGFAPTLTPTTGRWLPGEPDGTTLPVIDLSDGSALAIELPDSGLSADRLTLRSGASSAIYYSSGSGSLVLVDFASATAAKIGSGNTYARGRGLAGYSTYYSLEDPRSVIVPLHDPSKWWEVEGGAVDIRDSDVLSVATADFASEVRHMTGTEQQGQPARFDAPVVGGMLTENGAVMVDTGGGVWSVSFADGSHESLGVLGMGADAAVPIGSDHLLVWGGSGTVVVGPDGKPGKAIAPASDGNGGTLTVMPISAGAALKCLSLQPGGEPRPQNAHASLWDVDSRTQLVELDGTPQVVSDDGCSAVSMAGPAELVIDGTLVDLRLDIVQAVSPDHTHVVGIRKGDGDPAFLLIAVADGTETLLESGAHFYAQF